MSTSPETYHKRVLPKMNRVQTFGMNGVLANVKDMFVIY